MNHRFYLPSITSTVLSLFAMGSPPVASGLCPVDPCCAATPAKTAHVAAAALCRDIAPSHRSPFPIRLRNLSASPQRRWTSFMVPTATLQAAGVTAPFGLVKPDMWPWQMGQPMGDQTRMWVRADLASCEVREIDLAEFRDIPSAPSIAGPVRFDWLLDRPEQAALTIRLDDLEVPLQFDRFVELGPMVSVFRFVASGQGFQAVVYATLAVDQDVFDVQGYVVWSDRNSTAFSIRSRISFTHGEGHAPLLLRSLGQFTESPNRAPHVLLDGNPGNELPEAFGVPFFASLIAEADDLRSVDKDRLANAQAAFGGPILALAGAACWDGCIGPERSSIPFDAKAKLPQSTGFVDGPRGPWDARPWANPKATGQSGDQGCFGRIKALHMFAGADPIELMPLRYSSTDYWVRAHHLLDSAGQPLPWQLDPARTTYETLPFYLATGTAWGKGQDDWPPAGYDHDRGGIDPQHRGNLYMPDAAVLLGDFILQDELDFLLAVECRDVRHGLAGDGSLEAPRASGRLLQEWAHWWLSADPTQRVHLQELADRMFAIVESQPTWNVSGPLKVTQAVSRYEDKNPLRNTTDPSLGYEAWVPWQESMLVDGLTAWTKIWRRLGDTARCANFHKHALTLAEVVVEQGILEHAQLGTVPFTYVNWPGAGAPNPPAYFQLPRALAVTNLNGNADLVYGGIALTWYSGAILTAAAAGNAKALRLREVLYASLLNQGDWEWVVGDPLPR
jgi:hypothetical protein